MLSFLTLSQFHQFSPSVVLTVAWHFLLCFGEEKNQLPSRLSICGSLVCWYLFISKIIVLKYSGSIWDCLQTGRKIFTFRSMHDVALIQLCIKINHMTPSNQIYIIGNYTVNHMGPVSEIISAHNYCKLKQRLESKAIDLLCASPYVALIHHNERTEQVRLHQYLAFTVCRAFHLQPSTPCLCSLYFLIDILNKWMKWWHVKSLRPQCGGNCLWLIQSVIDTHIWEISQYEMNLWLVFEQFGVRHLIKLPTRDTQLKSAL